MNTNEYQKLASRTLIDGPDFILSDTEIMIIWNALGLAGEAGEVADDIKKSIFHRHGLNKEVLKKELGDVMWYMAALCTKLEINLSDVMEDNIKKLNDRYPDGYSSNASINRKDLKDPPPMPPRPSIRVIKEHKAIPENRKKIKQPKDVREMKLGTVFGKQGGENK